MFYYVIHLDVNRKKLFIISQEIIDILEGLNQSIIST